MNTPTNDPQAISATNTNGLTPAGSDSQPGHHSPGTHHDGAWLGPIVDPLLYVHVTTHGDLEQLRIASQHRLRILTATGPDEDGVIRGFGLDETHPDVARLAGTVEALVGLEHEAELTLRRAFRRCRIHPWVKAQTGLGDKQVARLLGAIGDPYWHLADERPRTVSELWAYCGLHVLPVSPGVLDAQIDNADGDQLPADHVELETHMAHVGGNQISDPGQKCAANHPQGAGVAPKRRRGQKANWSTEAKTRAYLCATSCIKQASSPYRAVYLARREHTAVTHPDWTPGHSHNDALRITSKAILRDLWREARRLHGVEGDLAVAS